ncbi:hypothetical protein, partial [Bacillus thuringiensis]|uniref:hypothetical protein n=1 Tax=Bacillus thuringiensis TaxID=1428 RepID=UPI0020C1344C
MGKSAEWQLVSCRLCENILLSKAKSRHHPHLLFVRIENCFETSITPAPAIDKAPANQETSRSPNSSAVF